MYTTSPVTDLPHQNPNSLFSPKLRISVKTFADFLFFFAPNLSLFFICVVLKGEGSLPTKPRSHSRWSPNTMFTRYLCGNFVLQLRLNSLKFLSISFILLCSSVLSNSPKVNVNFWKFRHLSEQAGCRLMRKSSITSLMVLTTDTWSCEIFSCVDFVRKGLNIDEDILGPGDFPCLVYVVLILTYVNWLFCPSLLLILWAFSQPQVQYIWKHFWIRYQEEF